MGRMESREGFQLRMSKALRLWSELDCMTRPIYEHNLTFGRRLTAAPISPLCFEDALHTRESARTIPAHGLARCPRRRRGTCGRPEQGGHRRPHAGNVALDDIEEPTCAISCLIAVARHPVHCLKIRRPIEGGKLPFRW